MGRVCGWGRGRGRRIRGIKTPWKKRRERRRRERRREGGSKATSPFVSAIVCAGRRWEGEDVQVQAIHTRSSLKTILPPSISLALGEESGWQ